MEKPTYNKALVAITIISILVVIGMFVVNTTNSCEQKLRDCNKEKMEIDTLRSNFVGEVHFKYRLCDGCDMRNRPDYRTDCVSSETYDDCYKRICCDEVTTTTTLRESEISLRIYKICIDPSEISSFVVNVSSTEIGGIGGNCSWFTALENESKSINVHWEE